MIPLQEGAGHVGDRKKPFHEIWIKKNLANRIAVLLLIGLMESLVCLIVYLNDGTKYAYVHLMYNHSYLLFIGYHHGDHRRLSWWDLVGSLYASRRNSSNTPTPPYDHYQNHFFCFNRNIYRIASKFFEKALEEGKKCSG